MSNYGNQTAVELQHSGLGISAFVLSLFAGIGFFILLVMVGAAEMSTPGGLDEDSLMAGLLGLMLIGTFAVQVLALVLSIVAMVQRDRKKLFGILGCVISVIGILAGLLVLIAAWAEGG